MTTRIHIRRAIRSDAGNIAKFNLAMAMETEQKRLESEIISRGVNQLFEHPEYGFYIIAEMDNQIAGCLLITYEWSDWRNSLFWWIQSVYIQPEFRRQGVYRRMYDFVKELAKLENVCGFRLYVEKGNTIARKTYEKLGMSETIYILYESDYQSPKE